MFDYYDNIKHELGRIPLLGFPRSVLESLVSLFF